MKTLSHYCRMAGTYFKYNIQSELEYPANIIGWTIINPFHFVFGIISLKIIISSFQPLGGWTFEQAMFLYGLGTMSHGFSILLFDQTWYMDSKITEGTFDLLLIRPLNVFFQYCFERFNFPGISNMLCGIIMFWYGCHIVDFNFTPINTLLITIVIFGATLIRGGIFTITGSLSFWILRVRQIIYIDNSLFDLTNKYPMSIFPQLIQGIFTFLLPIGFVCFYPASEFFNIKTQFTLPGNLCVWTLVIGIVLYIIGILVFNFGIKRYESAGS